MTPPTPDTPWTLSRLLAPMDEAEFLAEYFDRKPVHIPGDPDKFREVMNWDKLNAILNMTAVWGSQSLKLVQDRQTIPPARYCRQATGREGGSLLQPDAERVMALLRDGASLVANDIDTMNAGMRALADGLEAALSCKVQSNLYCSWKQRQAFNSHFDTHDVFALHMEGEKTWNVYETRIDHPVRHAEFTRFTEADHERQRGKILMQVTMTPGDLLYIPRGYYHDALASGSEALHLAYGTTGVIGLDVISALYEAAVKSPAFRHNLPRRDAGPEALRAHLAGLAEEMKRIVESDAFLNAFAAFQAAHKMPRGGFDLPIEAVERHYRVTRGDFRIVRQGKQPALAAPGMTVPFPPPLETPIAWVVGQTRFARGDLLSAFPDRLVQEVDRMLDVLVRNRVIEPVADGAE